MYNYFMLIGRKKNLKKVDEDNVILSLEVVRPFREADGEYKKDIFEVFCSHWMFPNGLDTLNKVDGIGIKGRLVQKDGNTILVADRIMIMGATSE